MAHPDSTALAATTTYTPQQQEALRRLQEADAEVGKATAAAAAALNAADHAHARYGRERQAALQQGWSELTLNHAGLSARTPTTPLRHVPRAMGKPK
jgi:hypothetical protein